MSSDCTLDSKGDTASDTFLDTRGLLCPLPVIRTQDAIRKLKTGDELSVIASDPGTLHDIPAWTRVHGHQLLCAEQQGREYHFSIKVT